MLDSDLVTIFEGISETMLGAVLLPAPEASEGFDASALTAYVGFSGGFDGVLRATFSEALARAVTSRLLQQPDSENSAADVRDAVGEIVNIAAGNLKGVLPTPCQLSLPHVQARSLWSTNAAHELLGLARFRLLGEPMWVELFGASSARAQP